MRYRLIPASEADKEEVRRVNDRCYYEVVVAQFGSWDDDLQREFFEKKWHPSRYQKIICDSQFAGIVAVATHHDHIFLSEIQVDPDFQGQGLGTAVVTDLIKEAMQKGIPIRLQVLLKNRAKSMYDRLGFNVTGETATHYLMERI